MWKSPIWTENKFESFPKETSPLFVLKFKPWESLKPHSSYKATFNEKCRDWNEIATLRRGNSPFFALKNLMAFGSFVSAKCKYAF